MAIFTGAGVAIVTPMKPNGEVNYEAFARHIEFQIENHTDAIIVCGTTGEASTLYPLLRKAGSRQNPRNRWHRFQLYRDSNLSVTGS